MYFNKCKNVPMVWIKYMTMKNIDLLTMKKKKRKEIYLCKTCQILNLIQYDFLSDAKPISIYL